MHIPDGFLPASVCAAGYAAVIPVTWYSLRKINQKENPREDIPKASILTAAFFVVSWIHIPIPPASVHLVLNGLLGAVLGYFAFPAILIGLFFQAVMFQHGGLTTLGVNALIMGLPAFISYFIFRVRNVLSRDSRVMTGVFGFLAGFAGLGLSVALFVVILLNFIPAGFDAETERVAVYALGIAYLPLMALEGVFTALVAVFLRRVRPKLLESV